MATTAAQTGANVRAEMARRNISQVKLANHLNLSQTAISSRLRGVTPFDVTELVAAAQFLNVPIDILIPRPIAVDSVAGVA